MKQMQCFRSRLDRAAHPRPRHSTLHGRATRRCTTLSRGVVAVALIAFVASDVRAQTASTKDPGKSDGNGAAAVSLNSYFRAAALRLPSGQPLAIRNLDGFSATAKPRAWPANGVEWAFVRGEGTQANLHEVKPAAGRDVIEIALEPAGWQMVGMDTTGAVTTIARDALETRLKSAGASAPAPPAAANAGNSVRFRHTESAKFIVYVDPPAGGDPRADTAAVIMSKSGQAAEFRLMTDPTTAGVGDLVAFCTYVNGIKHGEVNVSGRCVSSGAPATITRGGGGISSFRVSEPGTWMLEFTYAEAARETDGADWMTYHGVLTFETGLATANGGGK